jgi:hypothetical protein
MRRFLKILITIALLLGCSATIYATKLQTQKATLMNDVEVEVHIFSGRPNPNWKLSQEETQLLSTMLGKLSPTKPQDLFEGLGYRGFVITSRKPLAGASPVRIYKGVVKIGVDDNAKYFLDTNQQIEKWLLVKAKAVLNAEDYKVIANEIASNPQ